MSTSLQDTRPSRPSPENSGRRRGRRRRLASLGTVGLFLLVAAWLGFGGGGSPDPADEQGPAVVAADSSETGADAADGGPADGVTDDDGPPEVVFEDTLRSGRSLGQLVRQAGLDGNSYVRFLGLVEEYENPRHLQPGVTVRFAARVPERLSRVTLELDRDRSLHVFPRTGNWTARLDSIPVTTDTIVVGGAIESSLWNAEFFGDTAELVREGTYDERIEVVHRLSQIYAWQVDFFRDVHPGDGFRVLIERKMRPDGSVQSATVMAAEFFRGQRRLPAVRFVAPDGPEEYYDEDGEATRKAFLRAPLEFGRRTSGFTRRRYHPVLKRTRAHLGVDYGANRGTPVLATGSGTVTEARRWGGYGNMVEIRHNGRHRTRYAHLNGWANGIRPGARVEQGQVIGYVGSTGLSSGPHVHYEFLVNGTRTNPSSVDLPPGEPVEERYREAYERVRDARLSLLRSLDPPSSLRVAQAGDERSTTDR